MKLHILSDLHLERDPSFELKNVNDSDILILAGDIGDPNSKEYKDLIQSASKMYKYIFIIKGNHECYNYTIQETDGIINYICKEYNNVYYLNRSYIDIDNIRIIGTTLWSNIIDSQRENINIFIRDFQLIKNWSIDTYNLEHTKDIAFIKEQIEKSLNDNKELVVVTHHPPTQLNTSNPEYNNSPLSSAYSSNLEYLLGNPIKLWIYGHTHYSSQQELNNTKLVSNQKGIISQSIGFDPDFQIHLK